MPTLDIFRYVTDVLYDCLEETESPEVEEIINDCFLAAMEPFRSKKNKGTEKMKELLSCKDIHAMYKLRYDDCDVNETDDEDDEDDEDQDKEGKEQLCFGGTVNDHDVFMVPLGQWIRHYNSTI